MRTIVVGSRHVSTYDDLLDAIEWAHFTPSAIVSSIGRWGDKLGEKYAREYDLEIIRVPMKTPHTQHTEYERDLKLIRMSSAMIVLYSGMSSDTRFLFELAQKYKLHIFKWNVKLIS